MLTPQSISDLNPQKKQDAYFKDSARVFINTMYIGTATAVTGNTVTMNIYNKKPLNCQIFQNSPGDATDITGYYSQPLGTVMLRYISLAYMVATPQVGDTLMAIVPQSSIEGFFDGEEYGASFPIAEALVFPINTTYNSQNKLTINPNSDKITTVEIDSENLLLKTEKFDLSNESGSFLPKMVTMLTALGAVAVGSQTIDQLSGEAITSFITYLETLI